jgi:hypothetical protein
MPEAGELRLLTLHVWQLADDYESTDYNRKFPLSPATESLLWLSCLAIRLPYLITGDMGLLLIPPLGRLGRRGVFALARCSDVAGQWGTSHMSNGAAAGSPDGDEHLNEQRRSLVIAAHGARRRQSLPCSGRNSSEPE